MKRTIAASFERHGTRAEPFLGAQNESLGNKTDDKPT
jgi:hypothetical protein